MQGLEIFTKRQKMGRLATPEEVAALVVYLSSEEVRNCVCRHDMYDRYTCFTYLNCLSCSLPLLLELHSRLMEDGVCSQHPLSCGEYNLYNKLYSLNKLCLGVYYSCILIILCIFVMELILALLSIMLC